MVLIRHGHKDFDEISTSKFLLSTHILKYSQTESSLDGKDTFKNVIGGLRNSYRTVDIRMPRRYDRQLISDTSQLMMHLWIEHLHFKMGIGLWQASKLQIHKMFQSSFMPLIMKHT